MVGTRELAVCPECNTAFHKPPTSNRQKYCSKSCSTSARQRQKQERQASIGYIYRPQRKRSACAHCGADLQSLQRITELGRRTAPQKWCSAECQSKARSKTGKTKPELRAQQKARKTRVCQGCGTTYVKRRKNSNEGNKYCSRECAFADKTRLSKERQAFTYQPVIECQCKGCGAWFEKESGIEADSCSNDCQKHAREKAHILKIRYQTIEESHCVCAICSIAFCAVQFSGMRGLPLRRHCSEECRKAALRRSRRTSKAKRRALERNAGFADLIDPISFIVQAGERCNSCGIQTPLSLRGSYESNAPELDHVIPLSRGGTHSAANLQVLCRECNADKSDLMPHEWTYSTPSMLSIEAQCNQ